MARSEVTVEQRAVGRVIRNLREEQGDTQEQLAVKAGVSRARVIDIELGHRASRRTYLAIAKALGMPVEEMDDLTEEVVGA